MQPPTQNPLSLTTSQLNTALSTPEQRDEWLSNLIILGEQLKPGAPVLLPMAIDAMLDLYSKLLDEVGPERFVAAYEIVLNTSKFRPDISELRAAAGANLDAEAKREFQTLIKWQRHHGRKLTNRGNPPKDPPLPLPRLLGDVIEDMGYGDIRAGLEAIWAHPALDLVRPPDELDQMESFRAVAGEKIERRWVEYYTRRKAEGFKNLHAA